MKTALTYSSKGMCLVRRKPGRCRAVSIFFRAVVGIGLYLSVAFAQAQTVNPFVNINASGAQPCYSLSACQASAVQAHLDYTIGAYACEGFGPEGVHIISSSGAYHEFGIVWGIYILTECDVDPNGQIPHFFQSADPCGDLSPYPCGDEYYLAAEYAAGLVCNESNPCNPADGNKSEREIDYVSTAEGGLSFTRYYNSLGAFRTAGQMGMGWRHSYSRTLDEQPDNLRLSRFFAPANESSAYYSDSDACMRGWDEIKSTVWSGDLATATASFTGGNVCTISSGGSTVAYFPIRSVHGWSNYQAPASIRSITRPDGRNYKFEQSGTDWVNVLNPGVQLEVSGNNWIFTDENDTKETFDASGRLISITKRNGQTETLQYDLTPAQGGDDNPATLDRVAGPFGHAITFAYDLDGHLDAITTPDGIVQYGYDSNNNLTSAIYPDLSTLRYVFEDTLLPNHLTGIIDENGDRFATWDYDNSGRAILSEHAGGKERVQFAYNANGTTTLTMANGATRTYTFGTEQGRRRVTDLSGDVCSTCPGGEIKTRIYDSNGFIDERTDWNGNVTKTARNSRGLTETLTEAKASIEQRITTTVWHANHRLPMQITSPKNVTDFVYDTNGNPTSITVTAGTRTRARTFTYNANGQPLTIDGPRTDVSDVTTFSYYDCSTGNKCGQLQSVTNALSQVTTYDTYDASGRLTRMTDPNGLQTSLTYDNRGNLLTVTQTPTVGIARVTTMTYGNAGQLTSMTIPDGMQLTYSYDAAHYLRSVTDNFDNRIDYDYDAMGNLKDEDTYDSGDVLKRALDYAHDINNRLDTVTDGGGFVTDLTIDMVGNLTGEVNPKLANTQHRYDRLNRLDQTIDALSGIIDYGYDAHDNVTSVTAANSAATTYGYDDLDNLTKEISPDRGTIIYTYDDAGNRLTETDARGKITTYSYDALNRLTLTTLDDDSTIAYEYDVGTNAIGRLNKITDASGHTTWTYDNFGAVMQKTQTIGTAALTTSYGYDSSGRLTSMTLPSGKVLTYGYNVFLPDSVSVDNQTLLSGANYDPFGPVSGWTWGDLTLSNRTFDLRGLMTTHSLASGSRSLGYDPAGNVTSQDDAQHLQMTYDLVGRLTGFTSTSSAWLALAVVGDPDTTYLQSVSVGSGAAPFTWTPTMPTTPSDYEFRLFGSGGFTRIATSPTVTVSAAQSPPPPFLQVSATLANGGSSLTATLSNGPGNFYDWLALAAVGASNCSYLNWIYMGSDGDWTVIMPAPPGDYEFRLFLNNGCTRLATSTAVTVPTVPGDPLPIDVSATAVNGGDTMTVTVAAFAGSTTSTSQIFTYDNNGNRSSLTEDSSTFDYSTAASSNRLISTTGPVAKTYTHDAAGNIISDGIHSYSYDDRGRLTSVDAGSLIYEHNGQGQRVSKDDGSKILFAYDEAGRLIGEYDSLGTAIQETVYFSGAPVAVIEGSNEYYVHTDHLGTPRVITDGNTVIWRWESDPFGTTAAQEDPDGDSTPFTYNLRFPGQYYDQETSLNYNYFRDYDPGIGRYVQSDTIGLAGGSNTYVYVGANPSNRIDPYGLVEWTGYMTHEGLGLGVTRAFFNWYLESECYEGEKLKVILFGKNELLTSLGVGTGSSKGFGEIKLADPYEAPAVSNLSRTGYDRFVVENFSYVLYGGVNVTLGDAATDGWEWGWIKGGIDLSLGRISGNTEIVSSERESCDCEN